ncbi:MAG: hypothetical protein A4E57_02353 [Syntrophorhabdaceae bacterium PtaU1.Bin034]|nr:MAG: hypothetical protein A4E57_02353 [Syntrophorhabdaceae bacterium PtaU1.Bin034]
MGPLRFLALAILAFTLVTAIFAKAAEHGFSEYEVKAGFIYHIAKFVQWPEKNRADTRDSLDLCILGSDPFGKAFDQIEGRLVGGRRLGTKRIRSVKESKGCHMLFISRSEKARVSRIAEAIRDLGILTIGDTEGYAQQGIIVNFYMEGRKIRMEIDADRARQSNLTISSHLLKVARITRGKQ